MSTRVNHVVRSAPPNGAGAVVAEGYKHGTPSGVKIYKFIEGLFHWLRLCCAAFSASLR